LQFFDVALVLGTDKARNDFVDELGNVHERLRRLLTVLWVCERTGCPAATSTNILFYLFGCVSAKNGDTRGTL
jgi:hypothetical protein